MKKLLITLGVILVLLVIVDRSGDAVAQNTAASKLQSSQGLETKPDVDITGFPFLTQAVDRSFEKIVVTADEVPLAGGDLLQLTRLRVVLHDVSVSSDLESIRSPRADAEATIGYGDLSEALGVKVTYAGDGRIEAAGVVLPVAPSLVGDSLNFGPAASGVIAKALSLSGIPFDVNVNKLSVKRDGLHLSLTGRDLSYGAG